MKDVVLFLVMWEVFFLVIGVASGCMTFTGVVAFVVGCSVINYAAAMIGER